MTMGFREGEEFFFFITAMMAPLAGFILSLLLPPSLGIADSGKLEELHLGSFPSTRKDSPPNLSKSNKGKATAACLGHSGALQAMQAGPMAQHQISSHREKRGENPPGKGQWERSLLLKYSMPTLCKSTRPKQFSSPGHCLTPCTHPFPTDREWGHLHQGSAL